MGVESVIVGMGIDIVQVGRLAEAVQRGSDRFLDRVFTAEERADCEGRRQAEGLAARFAAKEAAFKAFGTGWGQGMGWRDVEVVKERSSGRVSLRLTGRAAELARATGVIRSHLSLSHDAGIAAAIVILEGPA